MKEIEISWMGEVIRVLEKWFLGPIRDLSGLPDVSVSIPVGFAPIVPVPPVAPEAPWITTTPWVGQTPWYVRDTTGGWAGTNIVYTADTTYSPDTTYTVVFE